MSGYNAEGKLCPFLGDHMRDMAAMANSNMSYGTIEAAAKIKYCYMSECAPTCEFPLDESEVQNA